MRITFLYTTLFIFCIINAHSQNENIFVKGIVKDEQTNLPIEGVSVRPSELWLYTSTKKNGEFKISIPKTNSSLLQFSHISYQTAIKHLNKNAGDTLQITFYLKIKFDILDTVAITSYHQPETLIGKPNYSIFDFDFHEDLLFLLTSSNSLKTCQLELSNYEGKIFSTYKLPKEAGKATRFYQDYEGHTDLICEDSIFRLDTYNNSLVVNYIKKDDFNKYLKPISDTLNDNYYFNTQWKDYPLFNYYFIHRKDTLSHLLQEICNQDLLKLYNLEYYYLPPPKQLEARRIANYYKTDVHIIAALMSGFTQCFFYDALYAPLFILNDTICIFNHHNDYLYHFAKSNLLIDSIKISYHHPKNWRDWKKQIYVDDEKNKIYAYFSKDGHYYLKQINFQNGKEVLTYKLKHHSAEKIKIKGGYVYYVYRPFGSTQERFLYREIIE